MKIVLACLALAFVLVPPENVAAESRIFPVVGAGWAAPRGAEVESTYGSGPLFGGGLGIEWNTKWSAQARIDWFSRSGRPIAPSFVDVPSNELRWIPATLRVEHVVGQYPDQFLFLAGAGVWIGQEQFEYELIGVDRSVRVQTTHPAWSLGAGYLAHRGSVAYRLVGRWMASSGHRQTIRGNVKTERGDRMTTSLWTFGLEITPK